MAKCLVLLSEISLNYLQNYKMLKFEKHSMFYNGDIRCHGNLFYLLPIYIL